MVKYYRDTELGATKRWCAQCSMPKLFSGGEWIHSLDGRHRRWNCADCLIRIKEREKLK